MKLVTVGSKVFVTSFQLAGVQGMIADTPEKALEEIKKLTEDSDIGLVLISDDVSKPISDSLTRIRAEKSTPLIFSLPATGTDKTDVDYRVMLKKILGV